MKDYSFQGKCYIGLRGDDGQPQALRWIGDASQLQVKLSTDTEERQESFSGNRLTSVRLVKAKKAEFTLVANEFSKQNLALALFGNAIDVTTGTVTAEAFPSGLAVGDVIRLDHRDASDIAITDSTASTPKTLVADTDYSVESGPGGLVKILALGTPAYTQPFKAAYSYAAAVRLPMFSAGTPERYIVFDGINTVDNQRVRVELYRAMFDPAQQLDLITDSLSSLQLQGSVLFDQLNAADSNMGGFGRIELPADAITP